MPGEHKALYGDWDLEDFKRLKSLKSCNKYINTGGAQKFVSFLTCKTVRVADFRRRCVYNYVFWALQVNVKDLTTDYFLV